jgi:hypothetical protein
MRLKTQSEKKEGKLEKQIISIMELSVGEHSLEEVINRVKEDNEQS